MKEVIEISKLRKTYKDKVAVEGLDLNIHENEVFALLGPNGAGKTTTIKMLCCLLPPTSGKASIYGYDVVKDELEVKKLIAVSPQETAIARNLTALENIEMIAQISGKTKEEAKIIAEKFNLLGSLKAKTLSGGNQRRLSIAMALITKPKILFLDEPTLGLDIEARYDLWNIIKDLKKDTTIILTTHYLEEADALADRIGIIKNGKLVELNAGVELKKKYLKENETNITLDEVYMRIIRGQK